MSGQIGKVWLIGAGPGDAELLTLKAVRALQESDVLLVDDLVSEAVLAHARPDVQRVWVGKRGGCRSTPQAFIHRLMVRYAKQGKTVGRVKGGDPMFFGRGGEEAAYLVAHGVSYEVANGLTAGLVAASLNAIPLTHRDHCRGVTFVTAHTREGGEPNWAALAQTGTTLVIYMGMHKIDAVCQGLLAAGMAAAMPVAVIESASTPKERRCVSVLSEIAAAAQTAGLGSPAVIIVGDVVSEANAIQTLLGKTCVA